MYISFGSTERKAELGDTVELQGQTQDVVECEESGVLMLNIDADEIKKGDLHFIKKLGLTISNPETDEPIALGVELKKKETVAEKVNRYFEEEEDDDDDDSFFSSSAGLFAGALSAGLGGFGGGFSGGGFGGFGGGGFSGGGATRGF
jgi:uncharacterized membrane protein YgcG